jgi:hypothetical protein
MGVEHQINQNKIYSLSTHLQFKKGVPIAVYEEYDWSFADDKIEN